MKAKIITWSILAFTTFSLNVNAQQASLAPDQNPRNEEAFARYSMQSDSLTRTQGTTVQNTYKAYDWYESREERRKLRRERSYQYGFYASPYYNYNNSFLSPYYGGFGFNRWSGRNNFCYGW